MISQDIKKTLKILANGMKRKAHAQYAAQRRDLPEHPFIQRTQNDLEPRGHRPQHHTDLDGHYNDSVFILRRSRDQQHIKMIKFQSLLCLCLLLVISRGNAHILVWTFALSVGSFGVKRGIFTIDHFDSSRMQGPQVTKIGDNGDLTLLWCMAMDSVAVCAEYVQRLAAGERFGRTRPSRDWQHERIVWQASDTCLLAKTSPGPRMHWCPMEEGV